MTRRYRYGQANPQTLMTLEEPGRPLLFDADRGLVAEVTSRCNVKELVGDLAGRPAAEASRSFAGFGRQLMDVTAELADGKYLDRTGEMIEKVAAQTGTFFPHKVQRYMELSIIGARPLDQWNIAESTTKSLCLQVFRCSVLQEMEAAGVSTDDLPCQELCLASFQAAGEKAHQPVKVELARMLPRDGVCEFRLSPMAPRARARAARRRSA